MALVPLFADAKGRPVDPPDFGGAAIADTHAHLDMLDDPALALARASLAGVRFIATVADVTENAARTYESLEGWRARADELLAEAGRSDLSAPRVRVVVGCHPHNARLWDEDVRREFDRLAADPITCAIGEMGLDYHYDESPRDIQRERFAGHLRLAGELDLPGVVHLREAHDDGLEIMRRTGIPEAGCILHCFNLEFSVAEPFLELGCHVSFAGPVTFKKAEEVRDAAVRVPAGRVITETDCPFMAPEPFRGTANEPALVVFTAARVAEARGEDPARFATGAFETAIALLDRERS